MQLLTYPMALAQHGASVPLIQSSNSSSSRAAGAAPPPSATMATSAHRATSVENSWGGVGHSTDGAGASSDDHARTLPVPRRWVRDADELCIASIHRSNNINRINSYVATYKFDDPQWRPLLLPEVHVLPKAPTLQGARKERRAARLKGEESDAFCAHGASTASDPPPTSPPSTTERDEVKSYDVFIDYNKLTTLELISRHANYALRHLVQKGHAMYLVNFAQHSIVQMRGLVEASYVTCAFGIRGERLRTHIIHTGPIDVRDVLEIDPVTHRVAFDFKKPHVRRGVVAVSTVEGYGTWFQRKPMLWQRTRRIGALQSQMGCYDYQLCDPALVGRTKSCEVALLAPHVKLIGAQGGAEAVALVASSQVAQNERLYMGQFEAPVLTAVDAVHQLAHRTALHHQLLRPAVTEAATDDAAQHPSTFTSPVEGESHSSGGDARIVDGGAPSMHYEDPQLLERRRLAGMERLLPVSWVTRTPPPYVPLESDLPFRIQMSRPAVIRTDAQPGREGDDSGAAACTFPTGGSVGSPFVKGVPLSLFEYNIHQGVDHYIFDDAPSARPMKWWNQKSNMPYSGYLYAMRSGLLDYVEAAEKMANPLAPPSTGKKADGARVKSARRRRKGLHRARKTGAAADAEAADARKETTSDAHVATGTSREDDDASHLELNLAAEELPAGADSLVGHEDGDRRDAALQWSAEGRDVASSDRPPLHTLVAPNTAAQRRLRRYAARSAAAAAPPTAGEDETHEKFSGSTGSALEGAARRKAAMSLEDRADALLQRQLRLRRLRKQQKKSGHAQAVRGEREVAGDTAVGEAHNAPENNATGM